MKQNHSTIIIGNSVLCSTVNLLDSSKAQISFQLLLKDRVARQNNAQSDISDEQVTSYVEDMLELYDLFNQILIVLNKATCLHGQFTNTKDIFAVGNITSAVIVKYEELDYYHKFSGSTYYSFKDCVFEVRKNRIYGVFAAGTGNVSVINRLDHNLESPFNGVSDYDIKNRSESLKKDILKLQEVLKELKNNCNSVDSEILDDPQTLKGGE